MLRLSRITKDYKVADQTVKALKGLNLSFRKSEFVSVLGPSGCGKTTLLNIIGGLDKYTSGDLFINGKSTKEFKDADWDVYRNHRIGFIFQSYNLIPHQTILSNVELALTIAGIGKNERTKRAKQALDKVGLKNQYGKKPNQLSGGQCQRVAIARALVNEPEILLADEPTGALDTTTSEQIMQLIKEISKDRLVIMVTHNPDIAEEYSTRIIRLLDGEVVDDNNPFSPEDEKAEVVALRKEANANLKEKEIELTQKIEKLQNQLKNNEITDKKSQKELRIQLKQLKNELKKNNAKFEKDGTVKASNIAGESKKQRRGKKANEKAKMSFWTAFKLSVQSLFTKKGRTILTSIAGAIGIIGVSLVLSISCGVRTYINDMQNDMLSGNPITISQTATDLGAMLNSATFTERAEAIKKAGIVNVDSVIEYLVSRSDQADSFTISNTITKDYVDFVKNVPSEHVASLYFNQGLDVTNNIYTSFFEEGATESKNVSLSAIKTIYTSVLKETKYAQYASFVTSLNEIFMQSPTDADYIKSQYNILDGELANKENEVMIVVGRDRELTDLVLAQLGYYTQDEFMNIVWRETDDERYDESLDKNEFSFEELMGKEFVYYPNNTVFTRTEIEATPFTYTPSSDGFGEGLKLKVVGILEPKEETSYGCLQSGFFYTQALVDRILEENLDSEIATYLSALPDKSITSGFSQTGASGITYLYSYKYNGESHQTVGFVGSANAMASLMMGFFGGVSMDYYTLTAQQVGGTDIPYSIAIYPLDFEHKDFVRDYLDQWNSEETLEISGREVAASEREDITYTDNISIIISMVNSMIDIVTYALIGFTALSLVVSCVMIAIITYVSVVERTKEIGIIRSLGGRKRDVGYLFNAETFIIGLGSGLIGIGVTYLLSAIANAIVSSVSMISRIAIFPWHYALIMVCVSVLLTLISGLIPSMSAARRDPVVALRTE